MKYIPTLLIGLVLLPSVSFAQTSTPEEQNALLSLIQALTVQVQALEARLVALETEASSTPSFGSTQPIVIDMSQSPQDIEKQEAAIGHIYTDNVPYETDQGYTIHPIKGTNCIESYGFGTAGRTCGG